MQPPSFQRIAPYYDFLAKMVFGSSIHNAQKAFFSLIPRESSILIIGGGSGKILNDLINESHPRHITFIEASSKMLDMARKCFHPQVNRVKEKIDIHFIYGTEREIPADQQYDILMTFFFLDLYPTEEALNISLKLTKHLKPSGSWLFTDFCVYGNQWQRCWKNILLKLMYSFFKLFSNLQNQSLPDYQMIFKTLHYFPVKQKFYFYNFIASTIYRKLLS